MSMPISNTYNNYTNPYTPTPQTQTQQSATAENTATGNAEQKYDYNYLRQKYPLVNDGTVSISGKYLRACMEDPKKWEELEKTLADAEWMVEDSKKNVKGYQGSRITIDDEGKMTVETQSKRVAVNEGKRMRQINAAKSMDNIQMVMSLLTQDLAQCQAGLEDGSCDEAEVSKVKALIQKAQQKMAELSGSGEKKEDEGMDTFTINLLL